MDSNRKTDYNITIMQENRIDFRNGLYDVETEVMNKPWFERVRVFQEAVV